MSAARASQFCQQEATQPRSPWAPPVLAVGKGSAEPSTATHASLPAMLASQPPFCDLTLNIDCTSCWHSYFSVRLLFGQSSHRQPGVTFTSRQSHQRVSWPQRQAGKKGRTPGRPRSMGVFLLAQQWPSCSRQRQGRAPSPLSSCGYADWERSRRGKERQASAESWMAAQARLQG